MKKYLILIGWMLSLVQFQLFQTDSLAQINSKSNRFIKYANL